jgi:hypothetical protein
MERQEDEVVELLREIRDLLKGGPPHKSSSGRAVARTSRTVRDRTARQDESEPVRLLLNSQKDAAEWNPIWDGRDAIFKWLAMLAIAESEMGEGTALTNTEIAKILMQRFRLGGARANNIKRDLDKARPLVNRRPRGNRFEYFLTRRGLSEVTARRDALAAPVRSGGA